MSEFEAIPLRDQRSMTGPGIRATVDEITAEWAAWGQRQGWLHRPGETELIHMDGEVAAYVNEGRWVADCPACNAGMAAWPDHDRVWCSDCGRVWPAVFPAAKERGKAEWVLLVRPPQHRNWDPRGKKPQTVEDLKVENITHGFPLAPNGGGR